MLRPVYPITTPRLVLRPLEPADLDALHKIQSRADVAKYVYWEPRTLDQVAAELADRVGMTSLDAEGDVLVLAATLRGDLIGTVVLMWHSAEHGRGEVGFVLHPDHHGRGYATEAARELLRLGFDGLGLHRIVGRLDADNHASARVLVKLGMRHEGTFRESEYVKGRWADEAVYAMLADEWRACPSIGLR